MTPLLLVAPALALDAQEAFDSHYAQARFFARKRWWADAWTEIGLALDTPVGKQSPEACWLGAQIAWELALGAEAQALARQAASLPGDPDQAAQAASFADNLQWNFGTLLLDAPYPGMASRLQLDTKGEILDPGWKAYVTTLALRLRDRTALPATVALPAGDWAVNGQPATVVAGQETALVLPMRALGNEGLAALQVSRLELGLGTTVWLGPENLYPPVRAQAAWVQPAGRLLLSALAEVDLQGYSTAASQDGLSPPGWGVGARLGTEIFLGGPLALRPALSYRYAGIPGMPLDCQETDGVWICAAPGDQSPAHHLYLPVRAHVPGVELLVEYREAGRTTALGTGVRLIVEEALGRAPASGQARTAEGLDVAWESDQPSFTATGISMLAHVAIAF